MLIKDFQILFNASLLKRSCAVWRSISVHQDDPVQAIMVQILFEVEFTTLPSQVNGGSAFWYDLKVKQFVSFNRSPKNGILLMRLRKWRSLWWKVYCFIFRKCFVKQQSILKGICNCWSNGNSKITNSIN